MSEERSVKVLLGDVKPKTLTDAEIIYFASREVEQVYGGLAG